MSRSAPFLEGATITLHLQPWSVLNTTLCSTETGEQRYTISTQTKETVVRSADKTELARLVWRDVLSDKLSLSGGPLKSVKDFLDKKSFTDERGAKYTWVEENDGHLLQLFAVEGKARKLVARFRTPHRDVVTQAQLPATLAMTDKGAEIESLVVVSLALYLKNIRGRGIDSPENVKLRTVGDDAFM